jgi:gliding motility-associated-like protein
VRPKYLIIFLTLLVLYYASMHAQTEYKLCAGQKGMKYQVTGKPGSIFHWTVEGGQIVSALQTNTIMVNWDNIPGEYTINVYEETNTGCSGNTKSIKVKVLPAPVFSMGRIKNICEGDQIELNPGKEFKKYLWNDSSTEQILIATKSDLYWLEVSNTEGCSFRDTVTLMVNPPPKIDLGKDTMLCTTNEILLDAGNNGTFYQWSNGANTKTNIAHENEGIVWVKVTDDNGCTGSDSIMLLRCSTAKNINIPNAFTPDGDGHNDFWIIGGSEQYPNITVKIYDRWGLIIFESDRGYQKPWDGTSYGKQMQTGAYYYIIKLGDGSKEIVGSITLIR